MTWLLYNNNKTLKGEYQRKYKGVKSNLNFLFTYLEIETYKQSRLWAQPIKPNQQSDIDPVQSNRNGPFERVKELLILVYIWERWWKEREKKSVITNKQTLERKSNREEEEHSNQNHHGIRS
jgi:hypothetical protein